jgi:hypothetical protein
MTLNLSHRALWNQRGTPGRDAREGSQHSSPRTSSAARKARPVTCSWTFFSRHNYETVFTSRQVLTLLTFCTGDLVSTFSFNSFNSSSPPVRWTSLSSSTSRHDGCTCSPIPSTDVTVSTLTLSRFVTYRPGSWIVTAWSTIWRMNQMEKTPDLECGRLAAISFWKTRSWPGGIYDLIK